MKKNNLSPLIDELIPYIISFFAESEGLLQRLSLESGLLPQDLYQNLTTPEVQAGIIDFLLNNEELLIQFSNQHQQFSPQDIWRLRRSLPGAMPDYF